MNSIIKSTLLTLQKSKLLIDILSDEQFGNDSISPYYSSIGSHIRHIYDFYDCALHPNEMGYVDLTARKRNGSVENCCNNASEYLDKIICKLDGFSRNANDTITVIDDLGTGKIEINYTYSALFAQANSHTIHHYAIISYIMDRLGITINDSTFGYNPTTPKQEVSNLN